MKYIYCIKGTEYWELFKLSIKTLFKFSDEASVICIRDHNNYYDKDLAIYSHKIKYILIDGSDPAFPKISYRNNCFKILIENKLLNLPEKEKVVISDADVLWYKNPDKTFEYLKKFDCWGQIVTPLNFQEYRPNIFPLERSNIGYRTLYNAKANNVIYRKHSRYRLNGGLYFLSWGLFSDTIPIFVNQMRKIPVKDINLSESLLTNCLLSNGAIVSAFDKDILIKINIPFFGKKAFRYTKIKTNWFYKFFYNLGKGAKINVIDSEKASCYVGRDIAIHYMCKDQKQAMINDSNLILNKTNK